MGRAKKLFDDANELLDKIINEKLLTAKGIFGIFPANSEVMILFFMINKIMKRFK